MDALRLASGMGMGMGMEVVSGALENARAKASESLESVSSSVNSTLEVAKNMSASDVAAAGISATSKLQESATAGLSTAAQTAMATSDVLKTTAIAGAGKTLSTISDPRAALSSIGTSSWADGSGSANAPGRGARSADEEDSQSGGEESNSAGASRLGTLLGVGMAARLGVASSRAAEKEQLVPKQEDVEMEEGRRRSFGSSASSYMPSSLSGGLSSIGQSIGIVEAKPKEPETYCGKLCRCCPALTYQQRMLGFVICFSFGCLLSLSALSSIGSIFLGNPTPFAVKYTLGNVLSIGSSSFLVGPAKQFRDMFAPERRVASLVYFATLFGTLVSTFVIKVQILSLLCVVAQFSALTWYMLSYIPYGQQCLKRLISRFM